MQKVRIGVVGGNFGASFHWHLHPGSAVAAVCDLREDRLQRLKKTYNPSARGYTSYDEMLQAGGLDAVAVFAPVPLHAEMVIKAVRAGFHVISAVPVAHTLDDCGRVLEAVQKSGAIYMMAETSFYRPEVIWASQPLVRRAAHAHLAPRRPAAPLPHPRDVHGDFGHRRAADPSRGHRVRRRPARARP